MKKIVLLISILILSIFLILPAYAESVTVTTSSKIANVGETVMFVADLSESVEVLKGEVTVVYDASILTLNGGTWMIPGSPLVNTFSTVTGEGILAYQGPTRIESGGLFSVSFTVKGDAPFGETPVSIEIQLYNEAQEPIGVTNVSGSLNVFCPHDYTRKNPVDQFLKSKASCEAPAVYYYACAYCGRQGTETYSYGDPTPHSFIKKIEIDTYLANPGNCQTPPTYYYSCECGLKGNEVFASLTATGHKYDKQVATPAYFAASASCETPATYYYSCVCGAKGSATFHVGAALGHTGGTATCVQKAICTRCGIGYGDTASHKLTVEKVDSKYLFLPATCKQKAMYYKLCAVCGQPGNEFFSSGDLLPHTFSSIYTTDAYLKSKATCASPAVYYTSCVCGQKGTTTFTFGSKPAHTYQTTLSKDSAGHWYACSQCGDKKDFTLHTPGAAATETKAQTCTVCAYVIAPATGHVHSYATGWSKNAQDHWHACTGCTDGKKDQAAHVYTNICDDTCNTCGYVRVAPHSVPSEWMSDEDSHWYECDICGEQKDEEAHTPGPEATEQSAQICTVCERILQQKLAHTHDYVQKSDDSFHWNECQCGEQVGKVKHSFGEKVIVKPATDTEEGEWSHSCSVCDRTITGIIPVGEEGPEDEYEYKEFEGLDELESLEPKEKDGSPVLVIVIVVAVVLLGGGAALAFIIYRRNYW